MALQHIHLNFYILIKGTFLNSLLLYINRYGNLQKKIKNLLNSLLRGGGGDKWLSTKEKITFFKCFFPAENAVAA